MTKEDLAADLKAGLEQMSNMRVAMLEGIIEKVGAKQPAHILCAAALDVFETFGTALVEAGYPKELIRTLALESIKRMEFKLPPAGPAEGEQVH